ncbi:MAG: hypothetical protein JXA79_12075 [Deltaproteobacteria bacterium]|nr:hypothetical protein [Deltaproteobacteria bacterium]
MRSNLQSLQGTLNLLDRTQNRLATGLKVNSALDDPTAYFSALSLNSRASNLNSLKDQMSQAIQTIKAADAGITGITDLINQAKGIAKKAQGLDASSGYVTQYITLEDVAAGHSITIGGVKFTATESTSTAINTFKVGGTDEETAANLMYVINNSAGTPTVTASSLDGDRIYLNDADASMVAGSVVEDGNNTITESALIPAASDELGTLEDSYNEVLSQVDKMISDSAYRGVNLIDGENLTVNFEGTNSITIAGFDATYSTGLSLAQADWSAGAGTTELDAIESAIDTLENQASKLALNLGVLTARESFSTNIANLLTEGAGKFTLADMNEEGANMLALQTKQALSSTALSLSSQAAQSVMRLF